MQDDTDGNISSLPHDEDDEIPSSSYTTANTCSWTFEKSSSDVCMIRLDFDTMVVADPQSGTNPNGACTTDYFQGVNAATGTTSGGAGGE